MPEYSDHTMIVIVFHLPFSCLIFASSVNQKRSKNPKISWGSMPPDPPSAHTHMRIASATPTKAFYLTTDSKFRGLGPVLAFTCSGLIEYIVVQ